MKHWILLLSVTMMSTSLFILTLTQQGDDQVVPQTTLEIKENKFENKIVKKENKKSPARSLAAISPAKVKNDNFVYLGLKEKDLEKFPLTNKVSENWESKFSTSFQKSLVGVQAGSFQVKKQRSIIKKVNKSSRIFKHVIVRYRNALGNPYSFEALIDAETGSMVQSWNRTRYEKRLPIALDGTNRFLRKAQ